MLDTKQMVHEIDARLKEVRDEMRRLERARHALVNGTAPSRVRTPAGTPLQRRVKRADQAVELIGKHPGITIPQLAERMGIEPNYLYRVVPQLAEAGKVRRDGEGWHPPAATPAKSKPTATRPAGKGKSK